tara:strand:+ start:1788 stop:2222 length:435 start_codon:yes stop_codon:yes gene_type:complete
MPVIFVNPNSESHLDLLNLLKKQNEDLRVFVSEKIEKELIEQMPGKKAIGDIYDDSHIYTASEGAFCGIFYEGLDDSLREVFINSINQSSLKRIIWISNIRKSDEVLNLKNLTYIFISSASNYTETVLHLEEVESLEEKFIDLT